MRSSVRIVQLNAGAGSAKDLRHARAQKLKAACLQRSEGYTTDVFCKFRTSWRRAYAWRGERGRGRRREAARPKGSCRQSGKGKSNEACSELCGRKQQRMTMWTGIGAGSAGRPAAQSGGAGRSAPDSCRHAAPHHRRNRILRPNHLPISGHGTGVGIEPQIPCSHPLSPARSNPSTFTLVAPLLACSLQALRTDVLGGLAARHPRVLGRARGGGRPW